MIKAAKIVLTAVLSPILLLAVISSATAERRIGDTAAIRIDSPPLFESWAPDQRAVWSHTVHHPDATFIKLHFARLELGPGDVLRILDGQGRLVIEYTDEHNGRWARSVSGDAVVIELRASTPGAGLSIDRYAYGTRQVSIESICGSDQKEDVACYAGTPIEGASRAVGRMVFVHHGGVFACTGFLISGADHFLSNQHCIASQSEVDSLEVTFNYQLAACGGRNLATSETFVGNRLLRTSVPFDVALMTLEGRPSAKYGFLPLSSRALARNEPLYLPQHPEGGLKMVSVIGCQVSTPMIDGGAPGSDFGHQCDTEPGSSGSPVLDSTNEVVGLHHIGACTSTGGENLAVLMSQIRPLLPPAETTFALKKAKLNPTNGLIMLHGVLTPGLGSNGIDPTAEPVSLALADADGPLYSVSLPSGALHRKGSAFQFTDQSGTVANGLRSLRITPEKLGSLDIAMTARRVDLSGVHRSQVTITLQIGDDTGFQTISLREVRDGFVFP